MWGNDEYRLRSLPVEVPFTRSRLGGTKERTEKSVHILVAHYDMENRESDTFRVHMMMLVFEDPKALSIGSSYDERTIHYWTGVWMTAGSDVRIFSSAFR